MLNNFVKTQCHNHTQQTNKLKQEVQSNKRDNGT